MAKNSGGGGRKSVGLLNILGGVAVGAGAIGGAMGAYRNYQDARAAGFNPGAAVAYGLTGYRSKDKGGMNWVATANVAAPIAAGAIAGIGANAASQAVPQSTKAREWRIGRVRIGA